MRYFRVLTVVVLTGVVALTATLLTRSTRAAPSSVRAAAAELPPVPVAAAGKAKKLPGVTNTLRGALTQELQQLLGSHRLVRTPPVVAPLALAPGTSCFVGGCSEHPCVVFTQSAAPLGTVSGAAPVASAPRAPSLTGSRCTRPDNPHALPVSAVTPPVAAQ